MAFSRLGKKKREEIEPGKEVSEKKLVKEELEKLGANKNVSKVIMALINNRKRIVSKGIHKYATFFIGGTAILLGEREVIVGDVCYKLPKPKKGFVYGRDRR